jgi:hypothetical protein
MDKKMNSLLLDYHFPIAAFDFDGNILSPETPIYLIEIETSREVSISGHELDKHPEYISWENPKYRWHNDITESLIHFRDYHSDMRHIWPDTLKQDIEKAIENGAISASFTDLKEKFLIAARPFAIITARGQSPDNLARALWIISESLLAPEEKEIQFSNITHLHRALDSEVTELSRDQALRYYFERIVSYYPVSNPHTEKLLDMEEEKSMSKRKVLALDHYRKKCESRIMTTLWYRDTPRSYGFSDDSFGNIRALIDFFVGKRTAWKIHREDKIRIYFTGRKEDYQSLKDLGFAYEERDTMLVIKI